MSSRVRVVHGNDRRVEGVRVSTPDGEYDLAARAIICCSGGFQANAEMRARYLGTNADLMKVRGSKHNTGEVLHMLLALGVKAAGHWQGAHMSPIDRMAPDVETPAMSDGRGNSMNRYDYQFGITVNALGQRFFDEGEAKHAYTYAKTGRAVLNQPGGVAWQIYDQTGIDWFRHGRDYPATMVEAATLAELAQKIGIEPEPFLQTVKEFNAACREDIPFMAGELDGKCTVGITPKKSNWAVPLDARPIPRLPDHRRRHLLVRRLAGGHRGARHQHDAATHRRPVCLRRRDRLVLPQLSVVHRADPQRGVQPPLRPQRGRDASKELMTSSSGAQVGQAIPWPDRIHAIFKRNRISQVGYVPDTGHARLIALCQEDPGITDVVLTTEAEGVGLVAGAALGGQRAALLMQSAGVGNCINMFGLLQSCGFPCLIVVTMRGEFADFNPWQVPMGSITEPTLKACSFLTYRVEQEDDIEDIVAAGCKMAYEGNLRVAILLAQRLVERQPGSH